MSGGFWGQIDKCQIGMRVPVAGIDLNGLAEGRFRRTSHTLFTERNANVILNFGVMRIGLRRAAERLKRSIELLLASVSESPKQTGCNHHWDQPSMPL